MGLEKLPKKAKEVYLEAEKAARLSCKRGSGFEDAVARKSWAAVNRGWKQVGDEWVPKSTAEFSLYINKSYIDNDTGQRRWCAVASDIEPDSYSDEMSLELYEDFLSRIETKELPPERHRSGYWSGGIPYLSIAHYLDLDGKAVPGEIESVFIDGKQLKSRGIFYDNEIGRATYEAVRENFLESRKADQNKVRISIAFVDWGHVHKSNNFEFIRDNLDEICPECLLEYVTGKSEGKIFKRGHLIHEALTRVPVNKRTIMEVERSMTTQLEDAKSIIGEENAEKLEAMKAEMKSEATELVVKSEDVEKAKAFKDEDEEDDKEKKKKEKEEKSEVREQPEITQDETQIHLPGNHALSESVDMFLSEYDKVASSTLSYQDKLKAVQSAFDGFGDAIRSSFAPTQEEVKTQEISELKSLIVELSKKFDDQLSTVSTELAILKQKSESAPITQEMQVPVRRSMTLDTINQMINDPAPVGNPNSIRNLARKSTGLPLQ